MNRRELFAVGGAGVVGLLFPQKSISSSSVRPVLEGMTDEEMAGVVGRFPQGEGSLCWIWHADRPHGLEIREKVPGLMSPARWSIDGTVIHSASIAPVFERYVQGHRLWAGTELTNEESVNVRTLKSIKLFSDCGADLPNATPEYYRRVETSNGAGWFVLN